MSAPVDRRTHNAEMWDRPGLPPVIIRPSQVRCQIAVRAVEEQGVGE